MRDSLRHKRTGALLLAVALLAGCTDTPAPQGTSHAPTGTPPVSPPAAGSSTVTVQADPGRAGPPFDEPRRAVVPHGWTLSVWARTARPRLAVWTPDGDLLVSVPSAGRVLRFEPAGVGHGDCILV